MNLEPNPSCFPALPLTTCLTRSEPVTTGPQFPPLQNGTNRKYLPRGIVAVTRLATKVAYKAQTGMQ